MDNSINKSYKVLIVEDTRLNIKMLQDMLQKASMMNFEYESVNSLNDTFSIITKNHYDAVLLDLNLPDSMGIDTLKAVKKKLSTVPIIIITGAYEENVGVKAIAHGAQDYLVKGKFDQYTLEKSINFSIERMKIEEELKKASKILETMIDGVIISDLKGKITDINNAITQQFGYTRNEIIGKTPLELILNKEDQQRYIKEIKQFISMKQIMSTEYILKHKDGTAFPSSINISLMYDARNKPSGIVAVLRDITEQKRSQSIINSEREKLSITLKSIEDAVITTNDKGDIELFNKSAENVTNWKQNEVVGLHVSEVFNILPTRKTDRDESNTSKIQLMEQLIRSSSEMTLNSKNGTKKIVSGSISKIFDQNNSIIGYILVFQDITEQRKNEERFLLSRKLESIGQIASGIAHEINTPMQFIGDNARFFQEAFKNICQFFGDYFNLMFILMEKKKIPVTLITGLQKRERELDIGYLIDEVPRAIDESLEGIERVTKLISAMKDFTHSETKEKQLSDLNRGIESTIIISKNEWKYVSEMETDLDPDLPLINCVIDEINQVILNLIVNAAQAIRNVAKEKNEKSGKILIKTKRNGDFVNIIIKDTGNGIPEKIKNRIFDPFFTTKGTGKGTGQGLAITHDIIVNKHNGGINVDSTVGKGSTFTISLPI